MPIGPKKYTNISMSPKKSSEFENVKCNKMKLSACELNLYKKCCTKTAYQQTSM